MLQMSQLSAVFVTAELLRNISSVAVEAQMASVSVMQKSWCLSHTLTHNHTLTLMKALWWHISPYIPHRYEWRPHLAVWWAICQSNTPVMCALLPEVTGCKKKKGRGTTFFTLHPSKGSPSLLERLLLCFSWSLNFQPSIHSCLNNEINNVPMYVPETLSDTSQELLVILSDHNTAGGYLC